MWGDTMNNKRSVLVWVFLGMLIFQNFDLTQPRFELYVQSVDEASRSGHAHELLGRGFLGSDADQAKGAVNFNLSIYAQFKKRLPKQDKWQAATLSNLVIEESQKYHLDPVFIMAVIAQESSFRPLARGPVGEIGLMQLRPETAAWVARKHRMVFNGAKTLEHPFVNLKLGIAYVSDLRESFKGRANHYVSAYNMGARNVRRLVATRQTPKEYSGRVMKRYRDLYATMYKKSVVIAKK